MVSFKMYKSIGIILMLLSLIPLLYYINKVAKFKARYGDFLSHVERIMFDKLKNTSVELINISVVLPLCNEPGRTARKNKVLSYTLFGNNSWTNRYKGALDALAGEAENSTLYADWTVRIYHDKYLTSDRRNEIKSFHKNVAFCDIKKLPTLGDVWNKNARIWRFIPIADFSVDIMCSRDVDSPLLQREEDAMREWLESNKIMHVMRDNPQHGSQIMGGLWCFRNSKNRELGANIMNITLRNAATRTSTKEAAKQDDQYLLNVHIHP